MSEYGDFRPDSDGWDDGFNNMRDSGDDSSAFLTTWAEEPNDDNAEEPDSDEDWMDEY